MAKVKWKCPICNGKNSDRYKETDVLACAYCESESYWEDVLTDEQKVRLDRRRGENNDLFSRP